VTRLFFALYCSRFSSNNLTTAHKLSCRVLLGLYAGGKQQHGKEECISPADDGVTLMRIPDAIYESAETGKEVSIQY
jgi:hypothetical protein